MTDDEDYSVWLGADATRTCILNADTPSGLYLLEWGSRPVWIVGERQRVLIYLDDLTADVLNDNSSTEGLYLAPVTLAANPFAFGHAEARRPGQLHYYRDGTIAIQCASHKPGMLGRRIVVDSLEADQERRQSIFGYCNHWRLLARDIKDELSVVHEVDIRGEPAGP